MKRVHKAKLVPLTSCHVTDFFRACESASEKVPKKVRSNLMELLRTPLTYSRIFSLSDHASNVVSLGKIWFLRSYVVLPRHGGAMEVTIGKVASYRRNMSKKVVDEHWVMMIMTINTRKQMNL